MKKLMFALAAAAMAVGVQASTVDWSSGKFYVPGAGGNGWGTTTVAKNCSDYTMTLYVWDAVMNPDTMVYEKGDAIVFSSGDTKSKTGSTNAQALLKNTATTASGDWTANKVYLVMGEIVSTTGAKLQSQLMEMTWDGGLSQPNINFMDQTVAGGTFTPQSGSFDSKYGYWNASGWSSVPEPTSGLLLLLGVAGLALRRRRA